MLASIAKSLHVEHLLIPSVITSSAPSTIKTATTTPTHIEKSNRYSNATTAFGTPVSARDTWTDVCDTWTDSGHKEIVGSKLQFPEVGSFGSRPASRAVSPAGPGGASGTTYLSPMFEPAILEDPSLTPIVVDRF